MAATDTFIRLFRGRGDARGSWDGAAVRRPLTPGHFHRHLTSPDEGDWFGVYNVIGDRCSWGCVDIDTDDYGLAQNIRSALHYKGVPSWIEQTTRGYHVWVFPSEPLMSASIMRRALTAACMAIGYQPREVFPKQTKVTGAGLGNYVRLPFNGMCASSATSRMFVECSAWPSLADFLDEMDHNRASVDALAMLATFVPEARPTSVRVNFEAGLEVEDVVAQLGGLAYRIWRDGPLAGSDRSTTLVHLAHLMAQQGVPPQSATAVLVSADDRWGKAFIERGDPGERIIERIVSKAYESPPV